MKVAFLDSLVRKTPKVWHNQKSERDKIRV